METEIISEKKNLLLKRKEIHFQVNHEQNGSTPPRLEVRKTIASALKAKVDLVFIKKMETKTGTHIAIGLANIYENIDQARLVEPNHIIKRNTPTKKPPEEGKK